MTRRRSIRRPATSVDEVGEQAQAVGAAPLGVELDAEQRARARSPRRTARRASVVARTTLVGRRGRHARVRVDEVEVGAVGDAVEQRVRRARARPGSSRCAAASARRRAGPSARAATPSVGAPSSSLPSNRSWSPRQMPEERPVGREPAPGSGSTRPCASSRSIAGAGGADARARRGRRRRAAPRASRDDRDRRRRRASSAWPMLTRLPAP